ncbi:hypothetical protein SUGI_0461470 [Cryptomeria japonica]|nr:hypothetical protein SUGI_0461470 [Cryptomeria japonica]
MAMYQDFYVSNDGYTMQDGTPWIGNNPQDHPGMIQVFLGHIRALDIVGNELPCLVYVSHEKRPGFQHHKRAGAMKALVYSFRRHCNLIRVLTVDGTDHIATVSVSTLHAKHIAKLVFQAGFRDFKNFLFQYNNISIAPVNL